ncbi:MAG: hypothetical protein QF502_10350, partial [Nitrospinaceae bacterium]|nr:hypothetical protein [Nitrospinaceae bacterium]
MWIRRSIIMLMVFAQVGFASYVEAYMGDEEYHEKILREIKKINSRLVENIKAQMILMQKIQENIRQDINSIKGNLPQLQDVMERSAAETMSGIDGFESKLRDMESKVDNEVVAELKSQRQAGEHLQTELSAQFGQLKNELATDMVNLSKDNKQYFMDFNEGNKEKLQQIVQALGDQTEKLKQTQAVFKSDLIPALNTQSEEIRKALLAELAQARIEQKNSMESNHKQVVASLVTMDEKNKNLIEILKKSILVDEETKNLTAAIQLNIEGTNKNIDQTRKTIGMLQEVLISRLKSMTQEKAASEIRLNKNLDEIKKNQKSAEPRLVTLVDASRKIFEQSSQIQTDLKQSLETITSNQAQVDMANKKLAKLIEILKAIALEQGKIDQVLQGQGKLDQILQAQGKVDQVLQGQGKLAQGQGKLVQGQGKLVQGQGKLVQGQGKLVQGQGEIKSLVNKGGVDDVLKGQEKMQSYLSDLRNKANVNISRNNDILRKMKSKK